MTQSSSEIVFWKEEDRSVFLAAMFNLSQFVCYYKHIKCANLGAVCVTVIRKLIRIYRTTGVVDGGLITHRHVKAIVLVSFFAIFMQCIKC